MAFFPKKPLTPLEKGYIAPTPSATKVDGSGVVQPVSGTVTVNSGEGVDTSALAKEVTLQSTNTRLGNTNETAASSDTATSGINGLLKRIAQRLTSILTTLGTPFQTGDSIGNTAFGVNNGAGANAVNIQDGGNSITVDGTVTAVPSGTQNVDITANSIGIATEATLTAVKAKTDNLDVALSTRLNTLGQKTSANSAPVVIASDQSAIPISGTVTASISGVSTLAEQQTQTNLLTSIVPNRDAFNRDRVSLPLGLFDAQFTYDLQPLVYEQLVNTGATVTHDATNKCALLNLTSSSLNSNARMQSYEYLRYQPGKSQLVFLTFMFNSAIAGLRQTIGLTNAVNGFEFLLDENGVLKFQILSNTTYGNQTVVQSSWNLDKLDGTGASGITLDTTKTNIFILDFQALYVGTVRMGFEINGVPIYCHAFHNANIATNPYIATANLPVRVECRAVNTTNITATMKFICCSVMSEGGQELTGYDFSQPSGAVSIASGADTHILSIQPSLLFNSSGNRSKFIDFEFEINITGNNPMDFKLVIGQTLSGTTTFNSVNATYSAMDYNILGTLSGSASIIIDQGSVFANATIKNNTTRRVQFRYPITLDSAGAVRTLGRLTLIGSGVGGTTTAKGVLKWREIR